MVFVPAGKLPFSVAAGVAKGAKHGVVLCFLPLGSQSLRCRASQ